MRSRITAVVAALLIAAGVASCEDDCDGVTTSVECEVTCDDGDEHTYPNYVLTESCDDALAAVEVNRDLWIAEFCGAADRGTSACYCEGTSPTSCN